MAHTSSDFNSDKVEDRFYQSGKICKGLHLVDLYMYDSSLFGNVMIVEDEDFTLIIDAGTSDSAGSIVNYLEFHDINLKNTVVLPTHHHFDHIGGLPRLMDFLSKKSAKTFVLAPEKMHSLLLSPESYAKSAKKGFDGVVGDLSPLDSKFVRNLLPKNHYKLGDEWTMEVIETPGHCDDHVSPILTNSKDQRICFFGEALGINLKGAFSPIPASSAPDFNSKKYLRSIREICRMDFDLGVFSHVGGIARKQNIKQTCHNALHGYEIFRKDVLRFHGENPSTRHVVEQMFKRYHTLLSTSSVNPKLAKNLGFTLVYGILLDEGLK